NFSLYRSGRMLMKGRSLFLCLAFLPIPVSSRAQRPNNGGGVCVAISTQIASRVASDGQGGAFVAWQDYRRGEYDIFAQHLSATGAPLWTYNGIPISKAPGTQ